MRVRELLREAIELSRKNRESTKNADVRGMSGQKRARSVPKLAVGKTLGKNNLLPHMPQAAEPNVQSRAERKN